MAESREAQQQREGAPAAVTSSLSIRATLYRNVPGISLLAKRAALSSRTSARPPVAASASQGKNTRYGEGGNKVRVPPTLLTLPGEVRNQIYQYALTSSDTVVVTEEGPLPVQPGLVRACRQLRVEGLSMYYEGNIFMFEVDSLDATMLIEWYQRNFHAFRVPPRVTGNTTEPSGPGFWPNLLRWLEAYYQGWCPCLQPKDSDNPMLCTMGYMFRFVRRERERGASWRDMCEALESMKEMLGVWEEKWR